MMPSLSARFGLLPAHMVDLTHREVFEYVTQLTEERAAQAAQAAAAERAVQMQARPGRPV